MAEPKDAPMMVQATPVQAQPMTTGQPVMAAPVMAVPANTHVGQPMAVPGTVVAAPQMYQQPQPTGNVYAVPVQAMSDQSGQAHWVQGQQGAPPTGRWSDGLCDCCSQACPSCCCAFFCPAILAGQVASAVGYSECGSGSHPNCAQTAIILWIGYAMMEWGSGYTDANGAYVMSPFWFLYWPGVAIVLYIITTLRSHFRKMYAIPGDECTDCLVAWCCSCCAIAQMARHAFQYPGLPGTPGCDCTAPPPNFAVFKTDANAARGVVMRAPNPGMNAAPATGIVMKA